MEDVVYKSGYSRVDKEILLDEALKLKELKKNFVFNVVIFFDAGNGQETSIASFTNLDIACKYLRDSFKINAKRWLELEGMYDIKSINELKSSGDFILETTFASLILGDYLFRITITLNEIFTPESYHSENEASLIDEEFFK